MKFFVQSTEVGLDDIKKIFGLNLSQFEPTPEPPKLTNKGKKKKQKYYSPKEVLDTKAPAPPITPEVEEAPVRRKFKFL